LPAKRVFTCNRHVQRRRQRIDIAALVCMLSVSELFGRHKVRRTEGICGRGQIQAPIDVFHKAKIGQLGVIIGCHQNVVRLDIAAHQTSLS
jgi:hypothetical protein